MLQPMPATRTKPKKPAKPVEPEGDVEGRRKKSRLTVAAEAAARDLLLKTLEEQAWNLTRAARELELSAASAVIQALKNLAPEEYEAAKADGRISPGTPHRS